MPAKTQNIIEKTLLEAFTLLQYYERFPYAPGKKPNFLFPCMFIWNDFYVVWNIELLFVWLGLNVAHINYILLNVLLYTSLTKYVILKHV